MLCAKFGWNWLRGSGEKKMKMLKVYDNTNNNDGHWTMDKFLLKKLTWAFGSGELKIKEPLSYIYYSYFIVFLSERDEVCASFDSKYTFTKVYV